MKVLQFRGQGPTYPGKFKGSPGISIREINKRCLLFLRNLPSQTNMVPENGWLEYDRFLWGPAYFQVRLLLVSGRVSAGKIHVASISLAPRRRRGDPLDSLYQQKPHAIRPYQERNCVSNNHLKKSIHQIE